VSLVLRYVFVHAAPTASVDRGHCHSDSRGDNIIHPDSFQGFKYSRGALRILAEPGAGLFPVGHPHI